METYKIYNGTSYNYNTPDKLIQILDDVYKKGTRIRVFYGDVKTGKDYCEVFDTMGTVGRSCGVNKIPLLIKTKKSDGGFALLENGIVKITIDKNTVYQHPKYHLPKLEIREATNDMKKLGYMYSVFTDEENTYNCKTLAQANNEIDYLKGIKNKSK